MKPIGILGGGQLARMLALAAHPLGLRCRVFDPAASPPAATVAEHIRADYEDGRALCRFADGLEVATYEFEHVPESALAVLQDRVDVLPGVDALRISRDRLIEKTFVRDQGIGTADFVAIDDVADVDDAIAQFGLPLIVKTRTQGYDGRGQAVVRSAGEARETLLRLGTRGLIAESLVPFDRELSIVAVRSSCGEVATYPLVENYHCGGVLRWTLAPAADVDPFLQRESEEIVRRIFIALEFVGVMTVELFQVGSRLLVNELAPRVHNSGHWTIEGSETSQFENHLRALLGLPLGSTSATGSWVMLNLLGDTPAHRRVLELPGAHLHLYDKAPRPGRKLGHVTYRTDDPRAARPRLEAILGLR